MGAQVMCGRDHRQSRGKAVQPPYRGCARVGSVRSWITPQARRENALLPRKWCRDDPKDAWVQGLEAPRADGISECGVRQTTCSGLPARHEAVLPGGQRRHRPVHLYLGRELPSTSHLRPSYRQGVTPPVDTYFGRERAPSDTFRPNYCGWVSRTRRASGGRFTVTAPP